MAKIIYFYQGLSLRQYCLSHKINYDCILARIEDLKKVKPNLNSDEIVTEALENYQDPRCRFTYQGLSLRSYCEKHNYSYQRI